MHLLNYVHLLGCFHFPVLLKPSQQSSSACNDSMCNVERSIRGRMTALSVHLEVFVMREGSSHVALIDLQC